MSFLVSARKYRPQKFEEVLGQEHITNTLKNAILSDKLAHAFLFCGPRGVGKTTCARILAHLINLDDPVTAISTGDYGEMDTNISMNIFEQDAASNNSVENMRSLIDQIRIPPQSGKYKVFIIDEVHMLSTAAFNAFLKTLEEPPAYAIFILATTEKNKIIPTVLSRCQIFDFRRVQPTVVVELLKKISTNENIDYEEDALYIIAEKGEGSIRDSLSIFDRINTAVEGKITTESVINGLNILDYDYFFKSIDLIQICDHSNLLLLFDEILYNGFEADHYLNGLAKHLRNLLCVKNSNTSSLLDTSEKLKKRYADQANNVSISDLLTFLNLINQYDTTYVNALDKRLHVEICLLKMCFLHKKLTSQPIKKKDESKPNSTSIENKQKKTPNDKKEVKSDESQNEKSHISSESSNPKKERISENGPGHNIKKLVDVGSLDDIIAEAKKEIVNQKSTKKLISLSSLKKMVEEYIDNSNNQGLKNIFKTSILELNDSQVKITVSNNRASEELKQEYRLFELIRNSYDPPNLKIDIIVDRTKFKDLKPLEPILHTNQDKLNHLLQINPKLEEFIQKLDLKMEK